MRRPVRRERGKLGILIALFMRVVGSRTLERAKKFRLFSQDEHFVNSANFVLLPEGIEYSVR